MKSLLLLSIWLVAIATAELKQIHVVTRHGARFPLTKDAGNLTEGTPGTLTPKGIRLTFGLGLWLRFRYDAFIPRYMPWNSWVVSSQFDRTVVSANSILAGFFGDDFSAALPVANVPVFTLSADHDVTIRAYDKCQAFLDTLETIYQSKEWNDTQAYNGAFLRRLAAIENFQEYVAESGEIPLTEVWNVYDAIKVAKEECANATSETCSSLVEPELKDILSDAEWETLQSLVRKTETWRYSSSASGRYVGRNLLLQILDRMAAQKGDDVTVPNGGGQFYLYSAHYPVLMGLLAAMGKGQVESREVIPNYAAALIFELHEYQGVETVQVHYRLGQPLDRTTDNTLYTVSDICDNSGDSCLLTGLIKRLDGWTQDQWCDECGNDKADVCAKVVNQQCETTTLKSVPAVIVGLFFVGFVVGGLVVFVFQWNRRESPSPVVHDMTVSTIMS
jgi:Histidine phosphatase superfamily (branch 2)